MQAEICMKDSASGAQYCTKVPKWKLSTTSGFKDKKTVVIEQTGSFTLKSFTVELVLKSTNDTVAKA